MGTPRNLSKLAENTDSSGVLGIASGGTGGSTAAAAKSALNLHTVATSGSYADLNNKPTTANITENTNLYYTDARARAAVSVSGSLSYNSTTGVFSYTTPSTSDIAEGTNLYFTDSRVRAAVSAGTNLSYNSTTGVFSTTLTQYTDALARAAVSAGTGLSYNSTTGVFSTSLTQYTDTLARAAVSATGSLSYNSTTGVFSYTTPTTSGITEGSNLYYTDARVRAAVSVSGSLSYNSTTGVFSYTTPSTSGIAEGSNLYYTDTRARAAHSAGTGISYNSTTGAISSTITQYTDALARAAVSAGTGLSYNSSTGVFSSTITQYTDALAVSANTSAIATAKSEAIASAATDATNKANAAQAAAIAAVTNGAGAAFDTLKEIQDAMATDAELAAAIASITVGNATQTIAAGTGLSGGGSFTANQTAASTVTLSLGTAGTSGTYTKVTTDAYGRVTSGTTLSSGDIPSLSGIYLPLTGGTLTGKVTFPSTIANRPQMPGGFLGLDTGDGNFDIWGISRDYYPSNPTAGDAWGIRWDGDSNQIRFIGGGSARVAFDLDDGTTQINGNTVLHAGNYNSYSPTLTGTGASGTWNINITGSAATATDSTKLPLTGGTLTGAFTVNNAFSTFSKNAASGANEVAKFINSGGGYSSRIYIGSNPGADWLIGKDCYGAGNDRFQIGSWNGYAYIDIAYNTTAGTINFPNNGGLTVNSNTILHAGNYNSYSPTLTGGGASGTWGISISGNAATVTNGLYKVGTNAIPAAVVLNTTADNWMWQWASSGSNDWYLGPTTANFGIGGSRLAISSSGSSPNAELSIERGTTRLLEILQANLQYKGNVVLHAGNYTSYAATSGHNHTYDVNNAWLRDANDDAHVKLYGNTRQMVFRTDGTTEFASGVGPYAFAWMYGGDAASERRMLLTSAGRLWTNTHGWMDEAFAPLSHVHSYLPLSGGTVSGVITSSLAPASINTSTPGLATYGFAFSGASSADYAQAITWGWSGTNAQAGIYVQSSGSYGTKMYIATTDSFATGAKTAVSIDHVGAVNITRGALTQGGNQVLHAGNYSSYALPLTGGSLTGALSAVSGLRSYYSDHIAGDGYGVRFWESDSYKISMGVSSLYQYGTVTDYSIKMQMNDTSAGRGFTWGRISYEPVAALNATSGNFQTAGQMYVQGAQIASGALTVRAGGAAGVGWGTGLNIGDSSNYTGFIQDAGISRWRNTGSGGYDWFNSATTQIMALSNSGYLGVGQASDASYRIIASGHIYANGNGNVYAEGRHYSRHGTGTFYESLTTGNYSSYALPLSGGSITGSLTINNSSPTIYMQDTDNRSAMIHVNSNVFYVLRGSGTNSGSWATLNGYWPMELNLETNNATFGGSISSVGNTVLHAGNFSSYSHSIATSDSRYSRKDTTSQWIKPYYEYGNYLTSESPATLRDQMGGGGLRVDFMNPSYTGSGGWNHVITFSAYQFYNMYQLGGAYDGGTGTDLWVRSEANHGGTSWTAWRKLLNSSNYNSYSPTLTGGNASGTWGISITGSAAQLQGYQWASSGKDVRGSQFYCDNWFRNYNSGTGLYNEATANHFYSDGQYWNVGYSGTTGIRLRNGHAGTILGYLYAETNQNMGLLNSSGNWAVQVYPGGTGGGNLAGTWTGGNIRANRANGNFYIDDNYGNGVVGVYSSYRYQGVFAMGDSYKLPADGTTTGSLYGMAWSHPNAGGAAGNLSDHGLLIINNGVFRCAISNSIVAASNITAYSDERLKTNWRSMPDNFVARLAQVRVGIYDRIDEEDTTQVGVSAQSFQELLPQAIMTAKDEMGTLSVSYGNAALASAVELAKEVVDLKTRVAQLEALINKLIKD